MIPTMRCFVALDLSAELVERLRDAQGRLRDAIPEGPSMGWVSPTAMHLTLRYLGDDVDVGITPALERTLRRLGARRPAFSLHLRGVGAYPAPTTARVIWAGLDPTPALFELWDDLQADLDEIGFPPDRPTLTPHVTLGRVRTPHQGADLTGPLGEVGGQDFGPLSVESLALYRSTPTPTGPRDEVLARAQLQRHDAGRERSA